MTVDSQKSHPSSSPVLVVDDERSICQFFADLFEEYGVGIDTENSGSSGLARIESTSYSLIFLDVKLGDMNGVDVLRRIKELRPDCAVIMISAYLTEDVIGEAIRLGADGYLYKPLSVRDIVSVTLRFVSSDQLKGAPAEQLS